jgi:O-antigen/teichoic acid export membrane protein
MKRSDTKLAAVVGGVGFIAATLAQLFLFRYSSGMIGLEKIGLVVLLQSFLFLTRLLDIGAGPNLTRRLAVANVAAGDPLFACEVWSTLLSITVPTILISVIALAAIVIWPEVVGAGQNEIDVITIAIALCISGVLGSIVAILMAAHEGIGDLVARGVSLIFFALAVVGCGVPLVANFGALGYALSVPAGLTVQFAALSFNLVWLDTTFRPDALRDVLTSARQQLRDNLTLNGISVCRLLFEPLTKYLLFVLGTLEIVAVFDVLNKVVTAVRVLVSTMMQPLLFKKSKQHAAGDSTNNPGDQRILYSVSFYLAAGAVASAPLIEALLFGGDVAPYVTFILVILALSSAINLSGQIAYLNLLAMAAYGTLLWIHLAMVVTNLTVSVLFGALIGEKGVVFGYAATMALGGIALHLMAPRSKTATFYRLIANVTGLLELLVLCGVTGISLSLMFGRVFTLGWSITLTGVLVIAFLFTVARPLFQKS